MHEARLVGFEWLAGYWASFAEACRSSALMPQDLESAVKSAISQIKSAPRRPSGAQAHNLLAECIQQCAAVFVLPEPAMKIPSPPEPPEAETEAICFAYERQRIAAQYASALASLQQVRTPDKRNRGQDFAATACSLAGNFHWVKSAPEKDEQHQFHLRERWSQTMKETGLKKHAEKTNHFVIWLNGGAEPDANAYMNCWEAVFFTAFKAGFVSREKLVSLHQAACARAQKNDSADKYFGKLTKALGARNAYDIVPQIGLMPLPGDIIFIAGAFHVMICVEVILNEDPATIKAMSLWRHPSDGFQKIDIAEVGALVSEATFAPFPF